MEPTNTEIKKDTVEESHENPSNADLLKAINKSEANLVTHAKHDEVVAKGIHERIDKLPTKEEFEKFVKSVNELTASVQDSITLTKNINVGFGVFRFTFKNAGQIGGFLVFLLGIGLFIKYGLLGIIAFFLPTK